MIYLDTSVALAQLLARVAFLEMRPEVLGHALEPFPLPVRTLDALHLASATYLRDQGVEASVATYDRRLAEAASALELELFPL